MKNTMKKNGFHMKKVLIMPAAVMAAALAMSCEQDLYLPPDWNYDIPYTPVTSEIHLGALYHNYTDATWASAQYTPVLNQTMEDGEVIAETPYTSTQVGVLTQQGKWAASAGIEFFVFPYNASETDNNLLANYEIYYNQGEMPVDVVINYSFSHLGLTELAGSGAGFDAVVADFKTLYTTVFSKPWCYRLPDGRPVIIVSGMNNDAYDYSLFVPAFRTAMAEFTSELQAQNGSVDDNAMNFYLIGENTANWPAPQTNERAARYLDANYTGRWYPESRYERWSSFYPFTDMAWSNWRDYAAGWGNDFIPCIYPEFHITESGTRSIDRSEENYIDFCNVAKRNLGSQRIVLINSWNDYTNDTALEPTAEYGEKYMQITYDQFKK